MQKAQAGHNPVAGKRERGRAAAVAAEKPPHDFRAIADRYLERCATKPPTWMELKRQLKQHAKLYAGRLASASQAAMSMR